MKKLLLILALCAVPAMGNAMTLAGPAVGDDAIVSFPIGDVIEPDAILPEELTDTIPIAAMGMYFQSGPVFNCSSGFSTSGACGWTKGAGSLPFQSWGSASPSLSGTSLILLQNGFPHGVSSVIYQTPINAQAFTSSFTFVPNGLNISFVVQNSNNDPDEPQPNRFVAGAGCEAGMYQSDLGSPGGYIPNFVFGIVLDSYSPLTATGNFTYSSAQLYQSTAPPCLPANGTEQYWYTVNKISTSPVPLTLSSGTGNGCTASPGNGCGTTTGDTYSATIIYTNGNVTLNMYDVTAGGTCTPTTSGTCFSQTWSGVNIPSIIGSNTGYIGLTAATGNPTSTSLYVNSFTDTTTTAPTTPPAQTYTSATSSGAAFVATPTLAPAPGTYSAGQSVRPSSTTANTYFCYTLSPTTPTLMPQTDGQGGCAAGTLVSGAITISSTSTLYIMGGINVTAQPNTANYSRLPSNLVVANYTIGGTPTAATPTFSPVPGTYASAQNVTVSTTTPAATLHCSTDNVTFTTCATPVVVSSSETLYAYATASGYSQSATASAVYNIVPPTLAAPSFSPSSGTYPGTQTVTVTGPSGATFCVGVNTTPTATVHGTCDAGFITYTTPITVAVSETLNAISTQASFINSTVATAAYVIGLPQAAAPTFSPAPGAYSGPQTITMSSTTPGASIYFTDDGTTPTFPVTGTTQTYTVPIIITATTNYKAIAAATGYTNSTVSVGDYTLPTTASITFTVKGGQVTIQGTAQTH